MSTTPGGTVPSPVLFEGVVGQERAVSRLTDAARRPVHAYLFHGPPGTGKRAAARGLAAALLCPHGGCGVCSSCRRALAGTHPDLVTVERTGAALDVDDAREIVARAQRRPFESARQVLVVPDVHLATKAAPALLKTVEEPPPSTVFVLLADDLPPGLATIVSRCVQIPFATVSPRVVEEWLVGRGVADEVAASVAAASGGNLDRARLLADDPGFDERRHQWRSVPGRLDGTGATAVTVADGLLGLAEGALAPLRDRHAREIGVLEEQAEVTGARGVPGRKAVEDRHKREERRWRTDDLRMGLAALADSYRDRLVAMVEGEVPPGSPGIGAERRGAAAHVDAVCRASAALSRNVREDLLLETLMVELSGMLE
ncbi:MAG: DNA polymerase III subunit delta' [Acidimicrobiales bacterium]